MEGNKSEKLNKLNKLGDQVRIGGKGSARRKRKVIHKNRQLDDKTLQPLLKKLGLNPIATIDEVNMFKEDGNILHFKNPKVQVAIQSNMFSITGQAETKTLTEMLPTVWNQMGPLNIESLKKLAGQFGTDSPSATAAVDDDDDVPDLVENFDVHSKNE